MSNGHNRRRFLQLTGAGAAGTLAGCAAINPLRNDESNAGEGSTADGALTAIVGPDREEIDALYEAIENGEMDPMEAQQRQQELLENAVDGFEKRVENDSELTIEESTAEIGLYRIDGSSEAIVGALREGPVTTLSGSAAYDRVLERQAQQRSQPNPESDGNATADENGSGGEGGQSDGGQDDATDDEDAAADDGEASTDSDA